MIRRENVAMAHVHSQTVPGGALIGAALLVATSIAAAALMRPHTEVSAANVAQSATAVESRRLHFVDRADGAVLVLDAANRSVVDVVAPGGDGFVRGLMRGMARERRLRGLGAQTPFTLTRWSDGRLTLDDPATGRWVALNAFGATNVDAFARFLPRPARSP
jgi:putative photosynthetic complex assembly protein